jgi:rod shape-determining protein MreC
VGALLEFIKRYSHVLLFITLQVMCVKSYLGNIKATSKNDKLNDNSKKLPGAVLSKKQAVVTDYFTLKEVNDSLLNENKRLREKLYQMEVGVPMTDSLGIVTYKRDSTEREYRYKYYAARVLTCTFDDANNYVTINRGFRDGIKRGMAVISGTGIVGEIKTVGPNHSVAVSILSARKRVSVQLKDGTLGFTTWDDFDSRYVTLQDVPPSSKMNRGDTVYTSGYSFFPANIMVGRLAKITKVGENQRYKVALSTNFRTLRYVYVVEDITAQFIQPLQDSARAQTEPDFKAQQQ